MCMGKTTIIARWVGSNPSNSSLPISPFIHSTEDVTDGCTSASSSEIDIASIAVWGVYEDADYKIVVDYPLIWEYQTTIQQFEPYVTVFFTPSLLLL